MKSKKLLVGVTLGIALLLFGATVTANWGGNVSVLLNHHLPVIRIAPSEKSVYPNSEPFTITVTISDVVDLAGFQFTMAFSPTIVHVEDAVLGDFLENTGRTASPVGPDIDNEAGTVAFGAYSIGAEPAPEGSGVLATLTLSPQTSGESDLHLQNVQVGNTVPEEIPVSTQDGHVRVCFFGDFNCDCRIDIVDIMLVAMHWNTSVGDPDYDQTYDLDDDGDTDILDILLVAGHWGETCETEVTKFQITSTGVQENTPLIFEDLVVYRRHGTPDVDLFGYNLGTGEEFPLVQKPGTQGISGLFGRYLVYIDNGDVRLLNVDTGEDVLVAGGPETEYGGGMYGDLVTYTTNASSSGGVGDLYVYNIGTGEREFIDSNASGPRIWGHNVVWYYGLGSGYYNIKGYDLQKQEFFEISSVNNGYQQTPDINGSDVVWTDGRDGKSAIYEKNLDTGKESLVYEVSASGQLGRPVIADRYIAWVHNRGVGAHDIFVQNRITGEIIEVSNDGPQQPSPTVPDIWEDTVVWMSWHTGNGDIYGATLKTQWPP